jgi:hypothetical protein
MAAAVAAIAAEALLAEVPDLDQMLTMCGFTEMIERAHLSEYERFALLDAFGDYTDTMIESMADKNEKRTPANTRVCFGIQRVLYVKVVSFWVRKQRREGIPMTIDDLNPDVITRMVQEMNLERTVEAKSGDDKLDQPDKFDPKRCVSWACSFVNYLDSLRGKSGVPLSYILRPEGAVPADAADEYQRVLRSAPFTGAMFREDNRRVYCIYKDLMIGTDGRTWFNRATVGDGRDAHLLITQHYRGDAETAFCASEAEAALNRLHYRNEASFPFERYITRMSECFELMDDNHQGFSEPQKVKKMLDGVISTNAEVVAIKAVVRTAHPTDFNAASTLMAGQIALLYPASNGELRNKRKISAVAQTAGRGRGRGRCSGGRGAGGRGGGGGRHGSTQILNGVDVSDPMRNFTSDEWKRLRESGFLSWLIDRRSGLANRRSGNQHAGGRGTPRGGRGGGRGEGGGRVVQIGAVTTIPDQDSSTLTGSNQGSAPMTPNGGSYASGGNAAEGSRNVLSFVFAEYYQKCSTCIVAFICKG